MRDTIDPISLTNVDESNELLRGRMDGESDEDNELEFGDDSLMWADVARASGVGERSNVNRATTSRARARSATSNPIHLVDEEEAGSKETEEEEDDEGYKSVGEEEEDDDDLLGVDTDDD
ncbi:uncharacterized protein LOC131316834 [Rhododendron vialii]|uniref:uncharacterized protein LOC131316834 n=1 Tax=Rhododendron vialii TaxID=182163 RepID=UPI00265E8252|nr:uncharacterized protein LOC131316834 [Rhododendron vialii]